MFKARCNILIIGLSKTMPSKSNFHFLHRVVTLYSFDLLKKIKEQHNIYTVK